MRLRSRSSVSDTSSVIFASCPARCCNSAVRSVTLLSSVAFHSRSASSACLRAPYLRRDPLISQPMRLIIENANEIFNNVDLLSLAVFPPDLQLPLDLAFLPESLHQRSAIARIDIQVRDIRPHHIEGAGEPKDLCKGRITQENPSFGRADEIPRQVVFEQPMELLLAPP